MHLIPAFPLNHPGILFSTGGEKLQKNLTDKLIESTQFKGIMNW